MMGIQRARRITQWLALAVPNLYLGFVSTKQVYQGPLKSVCVPFLNCHSCPSAICSCPVGIGEHFMSLHKIPFILMGYLVAVGMLVGSMACGWLCPFGLIQDLTYKIKSFKISIPRQLSVLRYFVLLFPVILLPIVAQETWFSKLCPMGTLQAGLPWVIWNPVIPVYNEPAVTTASIGLLFVTKLVILIVLIALFVIAKRPFCRVLCPLGAIFGLFNKYSLVRLKVDANNCANCDKCVATCPAELNVCKDPNATTCVRCLKCLNCDNVTLDIGGLGEKVSVAR